MLQANISLKTAKNGKKLNTYINRYNINLPCKKPIYCHASTPISHPHILNI